MFKLQMTLLFMFSMMFLLSSANENDASTFIDEHKNCEFWANAGKNLLQGMIKILIE